MEARRATSTETDLTEVERIKIERAYDRFKKVDYYQILNVPRTATTAQIKKNYHLVSKEYHPDRYFRRNLGEYKEKLEFVFDQITKAYSTLSDEASRKAYDKELIEREMAATPPTYEVEMEVGRPAEVSRPTESPKPEKPAAEAASTSAETKEEPKAPSTEKPPARRRRRQPPPLFLQKLQKQIMARMLKAKAYLKAGREAFEKGKYGEAVAHLQLALAYEPKLSEAKTLLEVATEKVNEVKAEGHYQRAQQEMAIGNLDNARAFLKAAVDCRPKQGHYYFKYASFLQEHKLDDREAVEHLKLAVEHDPQNVEYRLAFARALEARNMPLNAKREYERVLKIDKSIQEAQKALKRLRAF